MLYPPPWAQNGPMSMAYFPFTGEAYRPQMGLKPLEPAAWLEFDEQRDHQLALKRAILREHRDTVLYVSQEGEGACRELWELLRTHLGKEAEPPHTAAKALEQLSLWTQEDWCLMGAEKSERLVAGCVCFPSRWNPREKFGQNTDGIHGPVPDFAGTLAAPARNFLDKLSPGKPMWRLNWTIHDSDALFSPEPRAPKPGVSAENVLRETFLRVERQTLTRLPASGAVAFSIRTHLTRMDEVVATLERRELVRRTLELLPPEVASYRGMKAFLPELLAALA